MFDQSNNTVAIDVKMDGCVLEEKSSFKMLGCLSDLNWIRSLIYIAKTAAKKIGAFMCYMNSPEVAMYLYKSSIRPCMEYFCHVLASAPSCYLEMLDKHVK